METLRGAFSFSVKCWGSLPSSWLPFAPRPTSCPVCEGPEGLDWRAGSQTSCREEVEGQGGLAAAGLLLGRT